MRKPVRLRIEHLPKWLLCVPLVLHWFWLGARWRSLTLPSAANPGIEAGGLAGESKAACLDLIAPRWAPWIAPWCAVPPGADPHAARLAAGLAYPLIAKPDIGWCGYGVRRIDTDTALSAYAAAYPSDATYLLQAYVPGPIEAGLFYLRQPGARHGRLLATTLRHAPAVTGDGISTLVQLLTANPTLPRQLDALTPAALAAIPATGSSIAVTTIASLRAGATYQDASAHITPRLAARLDSIARFMPGFHVGRFDVRCPSLQDLQAGRFQIIEVNGAGAEAIQFWDPAIPITRAFAGVFAKTATLFRLGHAMRALGHRPVGVIALSRLWLHQQRLIARYPS